MVTGEKERTVSGSRGKVLAERTEAGNQDCPSSKSEQTLVLSKDHFTLPSVMVSSGSAPSTNNDTTKPLPDLEPHTSNQHKVADSVELIESEYVLVNSNCASMESLKSSPERSLNESDYVLVNSHCASMESLTSSLERTLIDSSGATSSVGGTGKTSSSSTSVVLTERQGLGAVSHSTRLQLLYQYARPLSDLALEKLNAGSLLEYISVELTTLAVWNEILQVAKSWWESSSQSSKDTVKLQAAGSSSNTEEAFDFSNPSTSFESAKKGFIAASDRADELSKPLEETDGTALVPNAIELIYEAAIAYGIAGAADVLLEKRDEATTLFSNAILLLSFIVWEAPRLPLKPPFTPHPEDKKRLLHYVECFEFHIDQLKAMPRCSSEQPSSSSTK